MLAFPVDFAEELDAMLMYDNTSRDQMKEIVRLDRGNWKRLGCRMGGNDI